MKAGYQKFVYSCNLILLVTEGASKKTPMTTPSSCYHVKVKSTLRFGLGWEFDNIQINESKNEYERSV
jgi:hypothetical protein